jgi:diguanylate cyclase
VNNTLKYVSIQHELGMAIGMALRLQPMLTAFSRVCLRRLGLCALHFHFIENPDGDPILHASPGDEQPKHFLSVPQNSPAPEPPRFEPIEKGSSACVYRRVRETNVENHFYSFRLGELGVITLQRRHSGLDQPIIELLKPLIVRLGMSCQASIEHENLLQAVAARRKAEETILFQLLHDDLTQLPNRRQLMQRLDELLANAVSEGHLGALLFLDLDRFKMVNDTLGHSVGDLLLVAVAARLQQLIGDEGLVGRLSGDEFVILLDHLPAPQAAARTSVDAVLDRIRQEFANAFIVGEHLLNVTPSIGVEIFPDENCTAGQILRRADTAMYQAKLSGLNSSVYYDRQLSRELEQRREIEKELKLALTNTEQFELHYQTQHNLAGECIGVEALIRWHSPYRQAPSPNTFIPVAEETGLMLELGRWVLRQACEDIRELQRINLPPAFHRISINVSAIQFNHPEFIGALMTEINAAGIDPLLITIELTETTLVRNSMASAAKIAEMRSHGIKVAIDDFGTGYSSLAYLSRLPVETIKIDRTFVHRIDSDAGNRAIVETIVALGRALDIELIAEGVETEAERACLESLGCGNYQGFLFGHPMPLSGLIKQLQPRTALSRSSTIFTPAQSDPTP